MKHRSLTLGALVVLGLALSPAAASAQTVDLAMTSFDADWDGETLTLSAEITLSARGAFDTIDTEVGFYLDDYYLGSLPLLAQQQPLGGCLDDTPPDCGGYCEPIVVDGEVISNAVCLAMNWPVTGPQCTCAYAIPAKNFLTPYHGEGTATGTVDYMNVCEEGDETNNSLTIALGPIAGESRSWSQVKALYR